MFDSFKERFNAERKKPKEVITPAEGLEEKRFSLPERDSDGNDLTPHDDWILTGEHASDNATLTVDLARYKEDGSVERRQNLPIKLFDAFQLERQAQLRFDDARKDLGLTAVRSSIVDMVRHSKTYEEWKPTEDAALEQIEEVRQHREDEANRVMHMYNKSVPRIDPSRDPRVRHPKH